MSSRARNVWNLDKDNYNEGIDINVSIKAHTCLGATKSNILDIILNVVLLLTTYDDLWCSKVNTTS